MAKLEKIKNKLKESGLRVTQARLDVASILLRNLGKPLTSEEVFLKISKSKSLKCDQVSVYRVLSKYEDLGIVSKSNFQGEAARYMIDECGKNHPHHHHFFKCKSCDKIEPFEGCFISKKEKDLSSKGYTMLEHHIEITGICPRCSR